MLEQPISLDTVHQLRDAVTAHARGLGASDGQVADLLLVTTEPTIGTTRPDPAATHGRGIWLCRQVCADLTITTGPPGTTVTATMDLSDQAARADRGSVPGHSDGRRLRPDTRARPRRQRPPVTRQADEVTHPDPAPPNDTTRP